MTQACIVLCHNTNTHNLGSPRSVAENTANDSVIHYICNLSFVQKEKDSSLFSTKTTRKKKRTDKKAFVQI